MKYLIIDKEQRIKSEKKFTYANSRIFEELELKNFEYDFLYINDIEIIFENSKLKILGNGIDLSDYTHILFRGHSLGNHREYETRLLITHYIEQKNAHKDECKTKVQNSKAFSTIPYYNKIWMAKLCAENNIPYFDSYYRMDGGYEVKRDFLKNYPLIIKDYHGANYIENIDGKGKIKKNVFKLESEKDFEEGFLKEKNLKNFFLQEYSDEGEDIRIFLSLGKIVGGWKRKATKNFMTVSGGEYTLYNNPEKEIADLAKKTAKAFNADFIATDFMFKNGKPFLQEISLNPGFKAYEQKTTGSDTPANIAKYIVESF